MKTDELYRAVRALVACRGWNEEQAIEHLLDLPEERRARIAASLEAWKVAPEDADPARDAWQPREPVMTARTPDPVE